MSLLAQPAPLCSRLGTDIGQVTGRQLDTHHQSRRDMSKWVPSPAEQMHTKKVRTPSEEEEAETDELVQLSHEECQRWERSRACSRSCNCRRQRAKSQARAQTAEATSTKESFIPTGYENTRWEELQREARREREQARNDKTQQSQQRGAKKAAQLEEKLKEEVLYNQKAYMHRVTQQLKHSRLPANDPHVRCLWIFEWNASSYAAQVLAIFDWAYKYFKVGGEYPVPKLPSWLNTYVHVTSIPQFPGGLPQLPKRQTAMNLSNTAI